MAGLVLASCLAPVPPFLGFWPTRGTARRTRWRLDVAGDRRDRFAVVGAFYYVRVIKVIIRRTLSSGAEDAAMAPRHDRPYASCSRPCPARWCWAWHGTGSWLGASRPRRLRLLVSFAWERFSRRFGQSSRLKPLLRKASSAPATGQRNPRLKRSSGLGLAIRGPHHIIPRLLRGGASGRSSGSYPKVAGSNPAPATAFRSRRKPP